MNRVAILVTVALVLTIGGVVGAAWSFGLIKPASITYPTGPGPTGGATAWCSQVGSLVAISSASANTGGQSPGCYNLPMTLAIGLKDKFSGAALNAWKCDVISAGGTYNTAPSGTILESALAASSTGVCTTVSANYQPGQALYLRLCDTTCSSAYGSASHTVYETVLPSTGSAGQGVVSFASISTQTSLTLTQYVQQIGSSTGYSSFTPAWTLYWTSAVNSTTYTSSATQFLKTGTKNACASAPCRPSWTFTLIETGTATTNPFGAGYTSFTQYESTGNLLQAELTAEMTGASNGHTCTNFGTSVSTIATKAGSSPDVLFGVQIPDSATVRSTAANGTPTANGQYTILIPMDCTTIYNGSDTTPTLVVTPYIYFNFAYTQANSGIPNSEAVALATAFTLTIKS